VGFAADKPAAFRPGPAASYSHQTNDRVTIGVDAYASPEKAKMAFGKLDPYQYGVLPVLVVMQNDSADTIRLSHLKVEYNDTSGSHVEATPPRDVRYLNSPGRPPIPSGRPIPFPHKKKNPLNAWEIEGRAFSADSLPPGNSAYGFFYFQTPIQQGATIYVSGLTDAKTGRELLYFEVPLKYTNMPSAIVPHRRIATLTRDASKRIADGGWLPKKKRFQVT
jgi:hypothetical protein